MLGSATWLFCGMNQDSYYFEVEALRYDYFYWDGFAFRTKFEFVLYGKCSEDWLRKRKNG